MNYGAMTAVDASVLEQVLQSVSSRKSIKFLEIGIHDGNTSRGIKEWCNLNGIVLDFWCIDNGAICDLKVPFDGAHLVIGDSAEVFHEIPGGFDAVLVDGCHCFNHVILDTVHYSRKIKAGGFLLFHDTSPELQQTMRDPHGPDVPAFYNSVNEALNCIAPLFDGWSLVFDRYEPGSKIGGMRAYRNNIGFWTPTPEEEERMRQ